MIDSTRPLNHLYVYVNNNPLLFFDLQGLERDFVWRIFTETKTRLRGELCPPGGMLPCSSKKTDVLNITAEIGKGCDRLKIIQLKGDSDIELTPTSVTTKKIEAEYWNWYSGGKCDCILSDYQVSRE